VFVIYKNTYEYFIILFSTPEIENLDDFFI
jgi:hypothetical protein